MFRPLLNNLHKVYKGNEIYIPTAVYDLITGWLCQKHRKDPKYVKTYTWNGKTLIPYDEDKALKAYQATPIHVPERILEKSIVIETSLEEIVKPEPVVEKEEKVEEPIESPTAGRRKGTRVKSFKHLF